MTLDDVKRQIRGQMPDVIANLRAKAAEHGPVKREAGYTIQNAAGDEAVVRIYDEIWWLGVNALDLAADLDGITAPTIRVEINSPGGDVFDGIAIYNALRAHPSRIVTRVDGMAASIASVIAQAGDHRIMLDSAQMMIHNAWGMTIGDHADHAETSAILSQQDEVIAGIYATASGKDAGHFRSLMEAETWMTAERAVAEGLADEVLTIERSKEPALADKIAALASSAVLDDVDRLVADHGDALTGAKREALVALRNRLDGILTPDTPQVDAEDEDMRNRRIAAAKRDALYRAELPAWAIPA